MIKPSEKNSNKNKTLMYNVFFNNIPNAKDFQIIYGYYLNDGYFLSKMISYIIGVNIQHRKIAIISMNANGEITEDIIYSDFKNIQKLKFISRDLLLIKLSSPLIELKINVQSFTDITHINSNVLPVEQENNFKHFANFVKKANLHIRNTL